jgi:hypothetical protein
MIDETGHLAEGPPIAKSLKRAADVRPLQTVTSHKCAAGR